MNGGDHCGRLGYFLNYMIIEKYITSFPDAQIENLNLLKKKIQVFYFILLLMLVDNKLIISKKRKKLDEARNFFQKILKSTFSKREKKEI